MSVFSNQAPRTAEVSAAYVQAVLELVGELDPVEVVSGTPAFLEDIVARGSDRALTLPEATGKWSIAEVIHHLADAELVWGYRLRRILTEEAPQLSGYDQDVWADRFGYADADLAESVTLFGALRRSNLRLVRRADAADLHRSAVHGERGEATLSSMLRLWAGHDLLHRRQIDRIRASVG